MKIKVKKLNGFKGYCQITFTKMKHRMIFQNYIRQRSLPDGVKLYSAKGRAMIYRMEPNSIKEANAFIAILAHEVRNCADTIDLDWIDPANILIQACGC